MFFKEGFRPVGEVRDAFFRMYEADKEVRDEIDYRTASFLLRMAAHEEALKTRGSVHYSIPTHEEVIAKMKSYTTFETAQAFVWTYLMRFLKAKRTYLIGPFGEAIPVINNIYAGGPSTVTPPPDPSKKYNWHFIDERYMTVSVNRELALGIAAQELLDRTDGQTVAGMERRRAEARVATANVARIFVPFEGFLVSIADEDFPDQQAIRSYLLNGAQAGNAQPVDGMDEPDSPSSRTGRPNKGKRAAAAYLRLWPNGRPGKVSWKVACREVGRVTGEEISEDTLRNALKDMLPEEPKNTP